MEEAAMEVPYWLNLWWAILAGFIAPAGLVIYTVWFLIPIKAATLKALEIAEDSQKKYGALGEKVDKVEDTIEKIEDLVAKADSILEKNVNLDLESAVEKITSSLDDATKALRGDIV